MFRLYEGARVATLYKKYRPTPPGTVFQKILNYLEEELPGPYDLAVDVGCGSGQVTVPLAPHFQRVVGCDISEAQIEEGRRRLDLPSNVSFKVAPAEKLPLEDDSAQLIYGGQCFHWLDLTCFYREVDRVLVPNGVLAAIGYKLPKIVHPVHGTRLSELAYTFMVDYFLDETTDRVFLCLEGYKNLEMPFVPQVRHSEICSHVHGSVADLMGFIDSLTNGESPKKTTLLQTFQKELFQILEVGEHPEKAPLTLRYDFSITMCRKPALTI